MKFLRSWREREREKRVASSRHASRRFKQRGWQRAVHTEGGSHPGDMQQKRKDKSNRTQRKLKARGMIIFFGT